LFFSVAQERKSESRRCAKCKLFLVFQVTEGTDGESREAVSEPGPSVDVGDPDRVGEASPRLSEHGEDREPEEETVGAALDRGGKPGSVSESEKEEEEEVGVTTEEEFEVKTEEEFQVKTEEEFEVKTEEEFESNEGHVAVKDDRSLGDSPTGPDASEDSHLHTTSEELENTNMDTTECVDTQQEEEKEKDDDEEEEKEEEEKKEEKEEEEKKEEEEEEEADGALRVSVVDDLDEMMDIGTVDQVEQEAQMSEEQPGSETDGSRSPSGVNSGNVPSNPEGPRCKETFININCGAQNRHVMSTY